MIYLVATPIGNMGDITFRAVETLKGVEIICCEDTRTSLPLLIHYGIKARLVSYHKFNEKERIKEIIEWARMGKDIAIISDAGLPGISDPGNTLVNACLENNIDYTVLPGASAFTTALVLSGFDNSNFKFCGFIESKGSARKKSLEKIAKESCTQIVYEAPHKLEKTLIDFAKIIPERKLALIREISKYYEDVKIFKAKDFREENIVYKGEIVIVIDSFNQEEKIYSDQDIVRLLNDSLDQGMSKKEAIKFICEKHNLKKNYVYGLSIDIG